MFYGKDCDSVPKPKVYLVDFNDASLYGLYWQGSQVLMLNRRLKPEYINLVMVHELMHHYDYELMLQWPFDHCSTERLARKVHHLFEGTEYNDLWEQVYRCTND